MGSARPCFVWSVGRNVSRDTPVETFDSAFVGIRKTAPAITQRRIRVRTHLLAFRRIGAAIRTRFSGVEDRVPVVRRLATGVRMKESLIRAQRSVIRAHVDRLWNA